MTQFLHEIAERIEAAHRSLDEAQADGDDYLAQVRTGEIESLQRLMTEHGTPDAIVLESGSPASLVTVEPAATAC